MTPRDYSQDDDNAQGIRPHIERPGTGRKEADETHGRTIRDTYEKYLDGVREKFPSLSETEVAGKAWTDIIDARRTGEDSEVLRDAEYYSMCQYAVLAEEPGLVAVCAGAPLYDGIKGVAHTLAGIGLSQLEKWMRQDKTKPLSPVGLGSYHAYRGLLDGMRRRNKIRNHDQIQQLSPPP